MTYLRWLTLYSAIQIHPDVRLVVRRQPVRPPVDWIEKQDFQFGPPANDWMPRLGGLRLRIFELEDIAPEIAALGISDTHTCDLLRPLLLSRFGGTTGDMDIVFLKPVPVIEHDVQVVVFAAHPMPGYVPMGFMQGRPCDFWDELYRRALASYDPSEYQSCGAKNFPTDVIPRLSERVIFPWAGPYPWARWKHWTFEASSWPPIPDDCIGLHWCASHAQKWNQSIGRLGDIKTGAIRWAVRQVVPDAARLHP